MWIGRLTLSGKRQQVAAKTQAEVRQKLQALRKAAEAGLPLQASRQTVAQYLADWLASAQPSWKPRTYYGYADLVRLHIEPTLGHYKLVELGPQHVEAWRNGLLAKGLHPRTVLHAYAVLRVALNRATKLQLVPRNVLLLVDAPKVTTTEIHPLTPDQASQVLAAAEGQRHENLYRLLVAAGTRLGEAQALRWQDVDIPGSHLRVRHTLLWFRVGEPWQLTEPKSARGRRVVPLIGPALAALKAQADRQAFERRTAREAWQENGFVFTNPLGQPATASSVDHDFKLLLRAAGLPTTHRVHDLRHSTATYLLGAGVPERVVMDILGA